MPNDPSRPFGPWLIGTANRRIIDRLRRQIRARSREIELSDQHETFSSDAANLHFDDGFADFATLHAAIATPAPDQRLAIQAAQAQGNVLKGGGAGKRKSCGSREGSGAPRNQGVAETTATDEPNGVTGTRELIDTLVECAAPVRRLRPPMVRATLWLAFAGLVLAVIALGHGLRADLLARLDEPDFAASSGGALLTGIPQ